MSIQVTKHFTPTLHIPVLKTARVLVNGKHQDWVINLNPKLLWNGKKIPKLHNPGYNQEREDGMRGQY